MAEVTEDFAKCWQAAGLHIQNQVQGELKSWLRSHINPPFLEGGFKFEAQRALVIDETPLRVF